jgi:hypothetical protein
MHVVKSGWIVDAAKGDAIRSEDLRTGMRVRVSADRSEDSAGRVGIVTQTYGDPEYRAAEVRFEGGGSGLF